MKLVELWLDVETREGELPIKVALDSIQAVCTTKCNHSILSKWRRGTAAPNAAQRAYMIEKVLPVLGITSTPQKRRYLAGLLAGVLE